VGKMQSKASLTHSIHCSPAGPYIKDLPAPAFELGHGKEVLQEREKGRNKKTKL